MGVRKHSPEHFDRHAPSSVPGKHEVFVVATLSPHVFIIGNRTQIETLQCEDVGAVDRDDSRTADGQDIIVVRRYFEPVEADFRGVTLGNRHVETEVGEQVEAEEFDRSGIIIGILEVTGEPRHVKV